MKSILEIKYIYLSNKNVLFIYPLIINIKNSTKKILFYESNQLNSKDEIDKIIFAL